ncbi:acetyltransferase [Winogradskyella haliclonae]|uniref:PglD N-terminal domain-containing protein n=1 Tax=Winogradskyella haliclonae TaxID=2048558 RepID=A0ABQ2BZY8_9FLAO|nr:acetyltransferase [Winogradskyella haliclonae]GGI58045.1 hypothetical protein GCM10011444_23540 [Winogradskyella haliclonae]
MLIIGAKGLAKELLEVCKLSNKLKSLVFYDNINTNDNFLYDEFPILNDDASVINYFKTIDKRFVLGFGDIIHRVKLAEQFINLGGEFTSLLSPEANISTFDVSIGEGVVIMPGAVVSNGVSIGKGCLVYFNASITHDVSIGSHSIISPGATLLGRCKIGNQCFVGANATILPDIVIGDNVVIGAGAVVTKNIENNTKVAGIPARDL